MKKSHIIAIIIIGVIILVLGILASVMGWGAAEHSEAAGHAAAAAHGVAHEEGPVWVKRLLVSL